MKKSRQRGRTRLYRRGTLEPYMLVHPKYIKNKTKAPREAENKVRQNKVGREAAQLSLILISDQV